MVTCFMPEVTCEMCGKRLYHENEHTLKIQVTICGKFCKDAPTAIHSYMHRDPAHMDTFDAERTNDSEGNPVLKK